MLLRLAEADPDFSAAFAAFAGRRRGQDEDVRERVAEIIDSVRAQGDAALHSLTRRFDGLDLDTVPVAVGTDEIRAAYEAVEPEITQALRLAKARIEAFHERQLPEPLQHEDGRGTRMGMRWTPLDSVGLYVPGGTAAYPSSLLMNAVPARVAGCERLVVAVPARNGIIDPLVLVAAEIAGVDEIYRIGGAQAVAALAFGTETIPPVVKIVGPGNAYVAEAKRQVFGIVGIDMIAGPSEIVVVADESADADWIAADLLSQAEHDEAAQAVLITPDERLAEAVDSALDTQLAALERRAVAEPSLRANGAIIIARSLESAVPLVDALAPEHLELMVEDPQVLAQRIRHAGSIFLGPWTPEVIGDYVGGPNHVLPTGRSARFSSGLSVFDFLKRTTWLRCDENAFHALAPAAELLAEAEGLGGHAQAVRVRRGDRSGQGR